MKNKAVLWSVLGVLVGGNIFQKFTTVSDTAKIKPSAAAKIPVCSGMLYLDDEAGLTIRIPTGFVFARSVEDEDWMAEYGIHANIYYDIRTEADFLNMAIDTAPVDYRPALTFQIHTIGETDEIGTVKWAKANFSDVPDNPQPVSFGVGASKIEGIKYTDDLGNYGKLRVYVVHYPGEYIVIMGTDSISDVQFNCVLQSIKWGNGVMPFHP